MAPKPKFIEGEKVLCFHGPLIYEAKCLKSSLTKEKQIKYLIHYAGWNKNWDEWVPESRVLKYNETNVQRQKEVQKAHSNSSTSKTKKSSKSKKQETTGAKDGDSRASTPSQEVTPATTTSSSSAATSSASRVRKAPTPVSGHDSGSDVPRKKRGRIDTCVESEDQFLSKVEIKVKIPDELNPWLVDDWDAIYRQRKLLSLPAKHTVESIINAYITEKQNSKSHNSNKESALTEVARGILEYFNVMLGSQLLYKYERPQYADILQKYPDSKMSEIYGSTHLLRLFVRFGNILAFTQLDEKSVSTLITNLQDFLKYMVKNSSTYFNMENYINCPPDYHRKTSST